MMLQELRYTAHGRDDFDRQTHREADEVLRPRDAPERNHHAPVCMNGVSVSDIESNAKETM